MFKNTKEAMLFAQRNKIPVVVPLSFTVDIKDDELLSCPFCGDKPQIEQNGEFEDVACLNVHCLVQPRALSVSTKSAREIWNTRVHDQ